MTFKIYFFKLVLSFIFLTLLNCTSKQSRMNASTQTAINDMSGRVSDGGPSNIAVTDLDCFSPKFSYRGDQILYICQENKFNAQPQIFLEDLNTGYKKQITFQNGILQDPHFLRPDLLVYLSSTDTRKEYVPLLSTTSKPVDELEVYSFDLHNDEIERLTQNNFFESALVPVKHIDPKIALVRIESGIYKVFLKNLLNKSEKLIFQTTFPVSEIGINDANQLLIVEDTGYKKWVRLIENNKKQTLWPEFKRESHSFSVDSRSGDIEYLRSGKIMSLTLKNLCESEIFSPTDAPVLDFQKSPVIDNLYVYTTSLQGLRRIEKKVISRNPTLACKKIVRRR